MDTTKCKNGYMDIMIASSYRDLITRTNAEGIKQEDIVKITTLDDGIVMLFYRYK